MVWLHVLTSVGWMAQALALLTLLAVGFASADQDVRIAATSMAHVLDTSLLAPLANASAFTGFLLSATTAWGFFRHWWVVAKFVLTIAALNVGIFVLSANLNDAAADAEAGAVVANPALLVGSALMAASIAFQAWLSVAKPWKRTPWSADRKPPTASNVVFGAAIAAPLVDIALSVAVGFPAPAAEIVVLIVVLTTRTRRLATARRT
ncbi:hypothetical protein BJF85_05515 [Saccharomonospora sp. CUA-673]|nr:hypothetical protein BJF85_05515 [Saccharomonospora sp. CUA-673]